MLDFIIYDEKTQTLTFLPNEAVKEVLVKDKAFTITYKDGKQDILNFETVDATTNKTVQLAFSGITFDSNRVSDIFVKDNANYYLAIHNKNLNSTHAHHTLGTIRTTPAKYYHIGKNTNVSHVNSEDFIVHFYYPQLVTLSEGETFTCVSPPYIIGDKIDKWYDFPLFREIDEEFYNNYHNSTLDTSILTALKKRLANHNFDIVIYNKKLRIKNSLLNNYSSFINEVENNYNRNKKTLPQHFLKEYDFTLIPNVSLNVIKNESNTLLKIRKEPQETLAPFIEKIKQSFQNIQYSKVDRNAAISKSLTTSNDRYYFLYKAVIMQFGNNDYGRVNTQKITLDNLDLGLFFTVNRFFETSIPERSCFFSETNLLPSFTLEVTLPLLADGTYPITVELPNTLSKERLMVSENKLIINSDTTFFVIEKTFTHNSELETFLSEHIEHTFTRKGNTLRSEYQDPNAILNAITFKIKQPLTEVTSKLSITTTLTIPGHPVQTKQHLLGEVFKR